jgi:CHC2 zinc finger
MNEFEYLDIELDWRKNHKYNPSPFQLAQTFPSAKERIIEILTELEDLKKEMEQVIYLHCGKENEEFATMIADVVFCEKERREKLQKVLKMMARPKKGTFTPAMIAKAREYPIDEMIEFKRNTARCPFHNEKTGSLHYYQKQNKAHCFGACGKSYDSIAIYMQLHSCNFIQAVKELSK